jgi:hypothetical protein
METVVNPIFFGAQNAGPETEFLFLKLVKEQNAGNAGQPLLHKSCLHRSL